MKTVHIGDKHIATVFETRTVRRLAKHGGFENVEMTVCGLFDGATQLSLGRAFTSPQDTHDQLTGDKLAFGRAVEKLTQDKDLRAQLWAVFHRGATMTALHADVQKEIDACRVEATMGRPCFACAKLRARLRKVA